VAVYVLAILTMAWLGAGVNVVAGLGAALFVTSDGMLAYDKFVRQFPSARLLVLTTYWLAQWLIALSVR
jgi:alkenylglycerophosphocholine/alkenylglycerophosphoethanolamine hydrolase